MKHLHRKCLQKTSLCLLGARELKAFIQLSEILWDLWVGSAKYYNYYLLYINICYSGGFVCGRSGLALCVLGLSRDFLVSTTIIDEDWVKPCGFALQSIKFSNCSYFQGKKKKEKNLPECIWMIFQCCGWSEIFFKKDQHVAIGEKYRLRLLVIKSSTADGGVRYFSHHVSSNLQRKSTCMSCLQRCFCLCVTHSCWYFVWRCTWLQIF